MSKANKSFKQTQIPYRAKSGEPMRYYILDEKCIHETEVTRAACLSRPETSDNPYPQRWYVDDESGLVIRLPRNEKGDGFARDNMQHVWRESKMQERRIACIAKKTAKCPKSCDACPMADICNSKHKATNGLGCVKKCEFCNMSQSRIVELDMNFTREEDGDDSGSGFELTSDCDVESIVEDAALLDTLYTALAALAPEDFALIKDIFWQGKTERELAKQMGFKQSKSVNKRRHKILEILRQNEALKSFFK
jgi:hypothetical protein